MRVETLIRYRTEEKEIRLSGELARQALKITTKILQKY